jgi:PhzF family phenazine biosynthesis protein
MDLFLIDAFSARPFAGNPAGVCWLDQPVPDAWMQSVARELNQAETAFLAPENEGFRLRWFTPGYEVDLCGHATLASAHFLWETGRLDRAAPAVFHTRSGVLGATREADGRIALDFPATPPVAVDPPPGLLEALGAGAASVFRNQVTQADYLLALPSAADVRALAPDFARLRVFQCRGVIATAPGDTAGVDFVSRFFAPGAGIDEDPVTGSAHCTLAPYWADRLGRPNLVGYQASARGGTVGVELRGDRVKLLGHAVTVVRGSIAAPEDSAATQKGARAMA